MITRVATGAFVEDGVSGRVVSSSIPRFWSNFTRICAFRLVRDIRKRRQVPEDMPRSGSAFSSARLGEARAAVSPSQNTLT